MKKSSLNHRYRLIWSRIQQVWIAVAEHVKCNGKKSAVLGESNLEGNKPLMNVFALTKKMLLSMVVISGLMGISHNVQAQWTDLAIQSGHATSEHIGNHLNVNVTSNHVIGTASSLSIAVNESVNVFFAQGGGNGLFRSTGNSATNIMGSLTSNGNLFLINPNGVLFGQGAQIDVGGLVASSMDISNTDFLNSNYQFSANGSKGGINNQGVIRVSDGGYLVLLGKEVTNNGTLEANRGSVVMAAGDSAVLDFYGNGLVKANLSGNALEAIVTQAGNVKADGGSVQLATNSRSSAVNVSGITQANTLVERNGVIRLEGGNAAKVSVKGTLNATGQLADTSGGTIEVTGEQVALLNGANVDVSGDAAGGTVLIGGGYQGENKNVYNARTTYVDQNASIKANAFTSGDAGKVITWANDTTRFYGIIAANGGGQSGNGGFVEVSGKRNLDFAGIVDVGATNGIGGKVLFDPENIILNNTTQPAPTNNADGTPDVAFADAPVVGATTIQVNDVRGFSELYLQATNDITVENTLSMLANNSVILEANNDINVNAEISTRGSGGITLNADNNINLNGRLSSYGTGAIAVTADADNSGAGDITVNQRIYSRGDVNLSGFNVNGATTAGFIQTQALVGQPKGDITINATNAINLAGALNTYGRNGVASANGEHAGDVNLIAGGAINTSNITAYGGRGGTGNTNAGNAGNITVHSKGVGDVSLGNVNARNGRASGTGLGGATGTISINNASGNIDTKNLAAYGDTNGDGGNINIVASAGDITVTGYAYVQGAATALGSTASGGNGGDINLNASGDVTVTSRIYAQGAAANTANSAAGGNGGNINVTGKNLTFGNVINSSGNIGRGVNQAGGHAGNINLIATGAMVASNAISANGGSGASGAGSNANAGDAGNITITSTGVGDVTTRAVNARNGAARGMGAGGAAGSINISNSNGNIATQNLETYGNLNGHGGDISVVADAGDVTVNGRVYSYGGVVNNGNSLAGRNGGNILISGANRSITSRIDANGNAAKGIDQAGGNAGAISVTGSGNLSVRDVYSRNGNATDAGAGGTAGIITLTGSTISASSVVSAAGNRNGDGGNVNLSSTTGDIEVNGIYVQGGGANTNTAGNNGGNITINSAGSFSAVNHLYAQGSSGNGTDNNGGDAGIINANVAGAITAKQIYAYGGNGGGNNVVTNLAAGGNAGTINLNSTAAGDITLSQDINVRTGFSRGSALGAMAGTINLANSGGSINTRNIRAEGQNHGNGGDVSINTGATGDVTVNGVIYTYGDVNPTSTSFVGTDGGNINITAANTIVTNTINTNGGRGRGANQVGGDAGDVTINANGVISTQVIAANGGNAGSGVGSNAAGGDAGNISLVSTDTGDITTTTISARTGYSQGAATANGAASVNIQNNSGSLTTGNITTRGQRRGVGGDIVAITTGGNISVGNVDARASNLAATDGGDVTLATTTGDAAVSNILTGARWLVYSGDPRNDTVDTFKPLADFKQYNTNYADMLLDTGNGFVYRFAPRITTSLTGIASKPYDGNNIAPIAGLTLNQLGGEIDGDTINISPLTSANYENPNVGTDKTVRSNALTVISGSNGGAMVYGYQVDAATGNVGIITTSPLSEAEAAANVNPRNVAGLGSLIDVTNNQQQFLVVFNVDATAAGGDVDSDVVSCDSNQDKKTQNPNTTLMLNFGITLPENVNQTCI
jgi:trimeric autotransporter adhesin